MRLRKTVETVCLLSRENVDGHINIKVDVDKLGTIKHTEEPESASSSGVARQKTFGTATYEEIKKYVLDKYGLKVSSLYIGQMKDKIGIKERKNYNEGSEGHRVPTCPEDKAIAILDAFKHFGMIS